MKPRKMTVEASTINSLLGFNLPARRLAEILARMGFQTKVKGGKLEASIPAYRCDILHPVDLAEDVAIGFNYDLIKPEPLKVPTTGKLLSSTKVRRKIRDLMMGFGFQEVASYILSSREAQTVRMRLEGGVSLVELANPTTSEYTVIRCWVIPSLLEFLSRNVHVEYPQRVFELGDVVLPDLKAETATKVECRLAAAVTDFKVSYEDVQAAAYSLLRQLGFKDWKVKPADHPSFIPGRAALLETNGVETVLLGEIHPQILESLQLPNPVAAMEVNLTRLLPEAFQCEKV
jgi:phenylalanyl-tRNA synthetase beta chain